MRILVVGGSGFIGRHVVGRLREKSHEVIVFDMVVQTPGDHIAGDISHIGDLWHAVRETSPEAIVQLAYLLGPETARDPYRALRVNVDGMNNVFEAVRLGGVRRVVFASSVVVHGPQRRFDNMPVTEASPRYPLAPYAVMKAFNEDVAEMFADRYGLETVAVRFSNLFGFGRTTGSSGPWADAIVTGPALGRPTELPVSLDLRTSMIYVADAAEYVVRLVLQEAPARSYLTGGYSVSVRELVQAVEEVIDGAEISAARSAPLPGPDVPVYLVDNANIVADTGHVLPSLRTRIADHAAEARAAAASEA